MSDSKSVFLKEESSAAEETAPKTDVSRRNFLQAMGATVVGVCVFPVLQGCEFHAIKPIGEGGAKGVILDYITPTETFYKQFGAQPYIGGAWKKPEIKSADWKLTIDGLGFDKTVTYAELEAAVTKDGVDFIKTMRCVFDTFDVPGLMGTGVYRGVPLRSFLPPEADLTAKNVKRLHVYGADGFKNNLLADRVLGTRKDGEFEVMLVTHMNGELLPVDHGAPVRIILHESYGFKNMKYVERIELSDKEDVFGHYEEEGGYSDVGALQVVSKVTRPLTGSIIPEGTIKVVGMAFSGVAGIEKVEVTQGGDTKDAKIVPIDDFVKDAKIKTLIENTVQFKDKGSYPFPGVWVQWEYEFDAKPGAVELQIRAKDKSGEEQPDKDTDSLNGTTGITILKFTVTEKVET